MSTSPIILRHATLNDLPDILEVFTDAISKTASADYSDEQIKAWLAGAENTEGWLKRIAVQHFLVACSDSIIAGFGSIENDYLDLLFVHPDYLRQGIATQLCKALVDHAADRNEAHIRTHASITARPFFESMGFSVVKENRFELKGVEMLNYVMIRVEG